VQEKVVLLVEIAYNNLDHDISRCYPLPEDICCLLEVQEGEGAKYVLRRLKLAATRASVHLPRFANVKKARNVVFKDRRHIIGVPAVLRCCRVSE
jgi:hypothetical protein